RVEHRPRIKDRYHAIARMCAPTLVTIAFDCGDAAIFAHADLERDIGLRAAAVGNESFLTCRYEPHTAVGLAREQRCNQFDVERLRAATEAASDMWLDHADVRHIHAEDLRQHQMDVVGDLCRGVHSHAIAYGIIFGDGRVHFHLVLTDLGTIVGFFA